MQTAENAYWPLWRKIIFRFLFIYFALQISPLGWLYDIPPVNFAADYYGKFIDWIVTGANGLFLHIRPVLVPENSGSDTSMGWARFWTYLALAIPGAIIWSVLDRRRANYTHLNYWLCLFTRYFLVITAFYYGMLKLFCVQMPFPSLHQLATPVGDLLPLRFSWLFIGYSGPYEFFSGLMEVIAGLLLFNRRTASLGAMVATAVFTNVMMMNLCYDISVKLYSMQLVFMCLFLLANESGRLIDIFILNKPAPPAALYHFRYSKKWMRITRVVLKYFIILVALRSDLYEDYRLYTSQAVTKQPVKDGIYTVTKYKLNDREVPLSAPDTLRWRDLIFENGLGSVSSNDAIFNRRYNRGYFSYRLDTAKHMLGFKKHKADQKYIMEFKFAMPDTATIMLTGLKGKDSLHVELKRINRHFQLTEKQFHWLSEELR